MKKISPFALISIALPLCILAGFWTALNRPISDNASDLPVEIQEIHQRMSEAQPAVILVGSSLIHRDIDRDMFAKELNLPPKKVQKLWSGMATMPAMSLMIENRILKQKLSPKVVAILAPPNWFLHTEVLQDANFSIHQTSALSPLMSEVLGRESEMTPSPWKQRKNGFQAKYQDWNQQWFGSGLLGRTPDEIEQQLDDVFAFEHQRKNVNGIQLIQHNVRETEEERETKSTKNGVDLRLLADIATKLKAENIHLVVVSLPVSRNVKKNYALTDSEVIEMIELLAEKEASFIDFFDWDERETFSDTKHMNARGRKIFTPLLASTWTELGILGKEPTIATIPNKFLKPIVTLPSDSTLLRSGEYIEFAFTQIRPGTQLTTCLSSDTPTTKRALTNTTERAGTDRLWCEITNLDEVKIDQPLSLMNYLPYNIHIHSIKLNDVELLVHPNIILGDVETLMLQSPPSPKPFDVTEATKWPTWLTKKRSLFPNLQIGELTRYKGLTDRSLLDSSIPLDCRPLELLENNATVALNSCKEVWGSKSGSCVHYDNLIVLQDSPVNWSTLGIQLKEKQLCHPENKKQPVGFWFFPGDVATTTFNWPKGDYSQLQIEGSSIGNGSWNVQLFQNDVVFLDITVTEPLELQQSFQLQRAMRSKNNSVKIQISVPENSNANLFIRRIELHN